MSVNSLNMLQTKGQMQAQDVELKQNQVSALNKSNMSPAEKEKKLREACEGFESIFIQKMWQQMRATLPQENPLVGREEKFWQSMYDQELAKKMASSGGIGLADMMYSQLSQNLVSASSTTAETVSKAKGFEINATPLMPIQNNSLAAVQETALKNASSNSKEQTAAHDIYESVAPHMGQNSAATTSEQSKQVAAPAYAANNVQGTNSAPLVNQYLANLQAKQGGMGVAQNQLSGPELARRAQLTAANAPPAQGVLPTQNSISGHALQAQNVFVNPTTDATGAALLQSQISGQPIDSTQPHIIRTTYTTNLPENQRSKRNKQVQLLTSGQPMVHKLATPAYPYAATQSTTKEQASTGKTNTIDKTETVSSANTNGNNSPSKTDAAAVSAEQLTQSSQAAQMGAVTQASVASNIETISQEG